MSDRWERVKQLFETALDLAAKERALFLARECGQDAALRAEVESLVREYEGLGSFMVQPAAAHAPETLLLNHPTALRFNPPAHAEDREPSLCGQTISHYRIHEQIGGGGMGAIYRAEDISASRQVALKFLTMAAKADRNALERFRREARIASSLIHPNICTVYEIEEAGGVPFISMELLHGQTIHDSIFRKAASGTGILDDTVFVPREAGDGRAFDLPTLLRISSCVLDGLAAAHAKDIVHRDIKPANIFLTRAGQVKILDFGLAKRLIRAGFSPDAAMQTDGITKAGAALGTLTYMSPEQIRGERVDARTDLFSFGAVMFEMATGRRAFEGLYLGQVLDAIVSGTLPLVHEVRPELPRFLSSIIAKAVEKDRERRFQSAAEMREALGLVRAG